MNCVKVVFLFVFIIHSTSAQLNAELQLLKDAENPFGQDPSTWAETFHICNGTKQSPINLYTCVHQILPRLKFSGHFDIRPEGFALFNTGYTVQILYKGEAPTLTYGPLKGSYKFYEIHFHWGSTGDGSEHQINGNFFGMEAHLVHFKEEYGTFQNALNFPDGLAVVALMFEETSTDNKDLENIISYLRFIREEDDTTIIPEDSMTWLSKYLESPGRSYVTYSGSLTTPPCNEVVNWIVLTNTVPMSSKQISQFRRINGSNGGPILNNRRPLQQLNNRQVICSL